MEYRLKRHAARPVWYVAWTEDGRTRRISTGCRQRGEAEEWLKRFIAGRRETAPADEPTIGAIIRAYEAHKPSQHYSLLPLRRSEISALRPSECSQAQIRHYARTRGAADGTVIRELGALRAALHWAEREGWPVRAVNFRMPVAQPPPRDKWATKDQARDLIAAARSAHVRLFIWIAFETAARSGAILGLTWDRVDFDARVIDFGLGRGNKRRSVVPISDGLYEALWFAGSTRISETVIEHHGRRVASIKTGFRNAADAAGIPWMTPHLCRHSAATWMAEAGRPDDEIARFLGDTPDMVRRVYAKHRPDYLRDAAAAVAI